MSGAETNDADRVEKAPDPDALWRRPEPGTVPAERTDNGDAAAGEVYTGPPPSQGPPPTPVLTPAYVPPRPPKQLPPQDHEELDAEDDRARSVSMGVAIVGGVLVVLMLVLVVVSCSART